MTPYGFVLLNAFWDGNALTTHDYPGQAARVNEGGAFLMSARQSRIGMRLAVKDNNWTGADLSGVLEFDFKGGHLSTASTAWYNGVMRLRLAAMTATWNTSYGKWADPRPARSTAWSNPLFAESLAWVADPLFWQAGNLWRRAPQIRVSYNGQFDVDRPEPGRRHALAGRRRHAGRLRLRQPVPHPELRGTRRRLHQADEGRERHRRARLPLRSAPLRVRHRPARRTSPRACSASTST